jgi:hypothetical protein
MVGFTAISIAFLPRKVCVSTSLLVYVHYMIFFGLFFEKPTDYQVQLYCQQRPLREALKTFDWVRCRSCPAALHTMKVEMCLEMP